MYKTEKEPIGSLGRLKLNQEETRKAILALASRYYEKKEITYLKYQVLMRSALHVVKESNQRDIVKNLEEEVQEMRKKAYKAKRTI